MEKRILIDLNDKKNWLYESTSPPSPSGAIVEENRVVLMPEGEHRLFAFTDAVMHHIPDGKIGEHEHHEGYETFFVDSGSMAFYSFGEYCELTKGDFVHIQPYVTHGMDFHEDVRYRGIFQDWATIDYFDESFALRKVYPDAPARMMEQGVSLGSYDFHVREKTNYVKVAPEKINAVRNPSRPLKEFKYDGVTMKMMVGRWECGGVREIWRAEMKKGFHAQWDDFPIVPELFYVTEGEVKFKVYEEEFTAHTDCLVKIPRLAPRSLTALSDAAMYDIGGLPCWYGFIHDYTSMLELDPQRAKDPDVIKKLKDKTNVYIKSIGMS